jgi:hypothetical protein
MATQNHNAVSIVGGNLSAVTFSGYISFTGGTVAISPGGSATALSLTGYAGVWTQIIQASGGSPSYGLLIRGGTGDPAHHAMMVQNAAATDTGFYINGALTVVCPKRLVIPVGANFWA